ncbi:MAG: MMPL family transporter [Clostridia bacterium]|nr:MMPL family transporter [Clostridia bacterium]
MEKVSDLPDIKIANGIANIEISEGMTLTDRYTKEKFAALFGIDDKSSERLFSAYALEHNMLGSMLKKEELELPLIDILSYLIEKIDQGLVPLSDEQRAVLSEKRGMVEKVVSQLKGKTHDRLILTASVTAEGEKSTKLLKDVRSIAEEQYGEGKVCITGQITSAADLRDSYKSDSVLISVLSIAFVFMILLFTFRSPVTAALLVFVIQGSIWINFSVTFLKGDSPAFVTNMIVSAIQMGATVDYAIVMTSRYKALRERFPKREAMIRAVNECFPTVLTSGLMLTLAGMLIAFNVSDVYVGHIGLAVGRGAAISVVLVLTALPQLLILFDKLMQKTTLKIKKKDT